MRTTQQMICTVIRESKIDDAEDAIRDMFTAKDYNGIVPDNAIKTILKKGSAWDRRYGYKNVETAIKNLKDDEFIKFDTAKKKWNWLG